TSRSPCWSKRQSCSFSAFSDQTVKSAPSDVRVTPGLGAEGGSCIRRLPTILRIRSGDHRRLVSSGALPDAGEFAGQGDEVGERRLRLDVVAGGVRFVALDVDAQRRAGGAGAGKAEDHAAAALEQDADALLRADGAVDRVGLGKIV